MAYDSVREEVPINGCGVGGFSSHRLRGEVIPVAHDSTEEAPTNICEGVDGFRTHHFSREIVPVMHDSIEEAPTNACVASLRLNWQTVVSGPRVGLWREELGVVDVPEAFYGLDDLDHPLASGSSPT